MWHEARKQERRIRGLIVDYRRRAERRQDFYEKIQADPTQFIQVHGRRCKIHLDPAVAAAGDGAAIIVPWQGQRDNLIDRFDVRAHLDCIPPVSKSSDIDLELSQEERQCNYERYRILAQNDFLNLTEEKFLHQLFLEEQFGANAPLDSCQSSQGKKKIPKSGAAIGYSYEDTGTTGSFIDNQQPYAHLKNAPAGATSSKKNENGSESDSESDIDMDVSIDVSKLDTSQAHELNACGRNYGMLSNDFYSYLTKDADEADAMRIAREEEREKMLLSGRKSRRERKAQKERRLARSTFSPPSYAAKEDNIGKDDESESRSPSPSDTTEKITYITSFGGEDELQPHSKITITLGKGSTTLGAACVDASTTASQASYAQKVKDNLDKLQQSATHSVKKPFMHSRSNSRSRSRSRTRRRSYRQARRSRSRSRSHNRRPKSERHSRSRSRSVSSGRRHYSRRYKTTYRRSRTRSRSKSRSRRKRYSSSLSSPSSRSVSPRRTSRRNMYSPKYIKPGKHDSRSSSVVESLRDSTAKEDSPVKVLQKTDKQIGGLTETLKSVPPPPLLSARLEEEIIKSKTPTVTVVEPPPPLKRYYGRKRVEYSSSSESGSETDDLKSSKPTESTNVEEHGDLDTTSETSNPLPSTSSSYKGKPQTAKYGFATSVSNAPETKIFSSSGCAAGGSVRLNLRERLKKKMQNLLNKQYKADKKAEIEKSERERQQQQERYEEMRELAIKLRRRQREIRHRYGTPNSKASESEASEYAATACREKRSKSHSSDHSTNIKCSTTHKRRSHISSAKRSRSREVKRSPSRFSRHRPPMTRSQSRSRRSSSRRRRRSVSGSKHHREPSQEHVPPRYVSERSRHSDIYKRSRSRSDRDRGNERQKQDRFRSDRGNDEGRLRSDRHREHRLRNRVDAFEQHPPLTSSTSSSTTATSRSRVVISAPPKLKKLVDY